LIEVAENTNELLQGVIAHELGNIAEARHEEQEEGAKTATAIIAVSLLLGAAAMARRSGAGNGR